MKVLALFVAFFGVATAFAPPVVNGRAESSLMAEKKSFFRSVFDMDLYAPVSTQNEYGARKNKNIKVGQITEKSYIPAGLTKAQYEKVRAEEQKKKDAIYQKNVAKAGKFLDFTQWYKDRGTDISDKWIKSATRGHTMAKTKYDFSGAKDEAKKFDGLKK